MPIIFNFKRLHPAFLEAIGRHEPTLAFTLSEGRGKFSFLLFLTTDSSGKITWGELELFIILATTQGVIRCKLLGNHKIAGDFKIRLTEENEKAIRAELGIGIAATAPAFDLHSFLSKLDGMIPASISLESKMEVIKAERVVIQQHCSAYIDAASKIYLLRAAPLPEGKYPREETLRKLYMLDAATADIAAMIRHLKKIRWTTYWTASEPQSNQFAEIFAKVAGAVAKR